ncbi:SubName: Full=Uncharacterized protein {ECO:0000313/EMBL:CCA70439.1} [Serendipita indica DSM 11827]|nr:SubName: Full=Uncharacterized protein {ECO:0000313/EMBL:CCA70439.1} [Serendipita indica DSM 11827]
MSRKTSVVLVGAGGANVRLAQELDKKLDPTKHTLTVISQADYYRHLPATLRLLVTDEGIREQDIALSYDSLFGKNMKNGKGRVGVLRIAEIVNVEEKERGEGGWVVLDDGSKIEWDILVVGTGSNWNGLLRWPTKRVQLSEHLNVWRDRFASAKSVLIVGAGSVGSELAGEIRDYYPDTQITLVHRDSLTLNKAYPAKFRQSIGDDLTSRGIQFVTDDIQGLSSSVMEGSEGVVPGERSCPPRVFTGGRTVFIREWPSQSTRFAATRLEPARVRGGDVTDIAEQHTLMKAGLHASLIAANIVSLLKLPVLTSNTAGEASAGLKQYTPSSEMLVVTNGKRSGTGFLGSICGIPIVVGKWLVVSAKSRDLFIPKARAMLNRA